MLKLFHGSTFLFCRQAPWVYVSYRYFSLDYLAICRCQNCLANFTQSGSGLDPQRSDRLRSLCRHEMKLMPSTNPWIKPQSQLDCLTFDTAWLGSYLLRTKNKRKKFNFWSFRALGNPLQNSLALIQLLSCGCRH